jgi:hypothetical protein
MQTRDREAVNLRKKAEVEKFKSSLGQVENKAKAAGTLFEKRLDDNLATLKTGIQDAIHESSSPPKSGKGATKKRK